MILSLVAETDPILTRVCHDFDFTSPTDPERLANDLFDTMFANNGIGLASPQVDLPYRVFVMGEIGSTRWVCFNPTIVETSTERRRREEGCLSFPQLHLIVERPEWLVGRYQNAKGDFIEQRFVNLFARCYSHELDHLDGRCFVDRVGPLARKMAFRRRKKLLKELTG